MEQITDTLRYFRAYFPDSEAGQLLWVLALVATLALAVTLFVAMMWLAVKLVWILLWAGLWLLMICVIGMGPKRRHHSAAA